jgi:hypothetical protein
VRESAIAGTWYPGNPSELERAIRGYLDAVPQHSGGDRPIAVVSPHAGYRYSGPTAAHAYAALRDRDIRRVVLLGPLHRPVWGSALEAVNVPAEGAYRTPLGDVPVDHDFIAVLARHVAMNPVRGDEEHSLEIQLPFLQVVLGQFRLVPLMLADDVADPGALARLQALAARLAAVSDRTTVLVASTDLSHLHDYAEVRRVDATLLERVSAFDVEGLSALLHAGSVQACGAIGLLAAMRAARSLGATRAEVLAYATSGDVTGDTRPGNYTVGYMAAAMIA